MASRRELFTAALAASVVISAPALATQSLGWDQLMADYLQRKAAFDAADLRYDRTAASADRLDDLCHAMCKAIDRLMAEPAPHLSAVLWKLEQVIKDEGQGFTANWSVKYISPILDDVRRLSTAVNYRT